MMLTPWEILDKAVDPITGLVELTCVQCGAAVVKRGIAQEAVIITADGATCRRHFGNRPPFTVPVQTHAGSQQQKGKKC